MTKMVSKDELQAEMLRIFSEIEQSGEELIVTDNNRLVLSIRPISHGRTFEGMFSALAGKVVFHEDPDTPASDDWEDL